MSNLLANEILENEVDYEFLVREKKAANKFSRPPNKLRLEFRLFDVFRSCIATPEGQEYDVFHCFPEQRVLKTTGEFYLLFDDLGEKIPQFLSKILNVPEANHAKIMDNIFSVARSITSKGSATSTSIFIGIASVKAKVYEYHEYLALERAQNEAMEAQEPKPIPATKASIDALERVVFDDEGSMEQCMICFDEFQAGTEVTRMSCSHIYHGDCIVQWLETSHMCPLCRFPMPQD